MRIFHWGAVLGTGAALRGCDRDAEAAEPTAGAADEALADPRIRARRAGTAPLPHS